MVLADRRRALGEDHARMICQLHQLLADLIPGGAKKSLSAAQARALLARIRPRDPAGQARRRVTAELITDLERIFQRKKAADKESGSWLISHEPMLYPPLAVAVEMTWPFTSILHETGPLKVVGRWRAHSQDSRDSTSRPVPAAMRRGCT